MNFGSGGAAMAWKDIWGCGQGIGAIRVQKAGDFIAQLRREYDEAKKRLCL